MKHSEIIGKMSLEQKATFVSGYDYWHLEEAPELGLPKICITDGPHGLRKAKGKDYYLKKARQSHLAVSVLATLCLQLASRLPQLHLALGMMICSLKRVRLWVKNALKKRFPLFSVRVQISSVLQHAAETLSIFQKIRFLQVSAQPPSSTAFSQRA